MKPQSKKNYIFASDMYLKETENTKSNGFLGLFRWGKNKPDTSKWDTTFQQVMQKLDATGELGTLEVPKRYIFGRLQLRWGPLSTSWANDSGLIYFGGYTDDVILGLVGSKNNIRGAIGDSSLYSTSGNMKYLFTLLNKEISLSGDVPVVYPFQQDNPQDKQKAILAVQKATLQDQRKGSMIEVEVCAQTLLVGNANPWQEQPRIVIGVPLYIATVDPE
jgi:hypothetical protein